MSTPRSARGFSVIFRCETFGVGLSWPTPTTETTPSTAGSLRTASVTVACSRLSSAKLTCGSASSTAVTRPVSCEGRKPLGMTTYIQMVMTSVSAVTMSVAG